MDKPVYLRITASPFTGIEAMFNVFEDGSFEQIGENETIYKIVRSPEDPLAININEDENSITFNDELGVLFKDEIQMDIFLNDLYFILEEYFNVPLKERQVPFSKELWYLENGEMAEDEDFYEELKEKYKGDENGEQDDRKVKEK